MSREGAIDDQYFRTHVRIECGHERYRWVNRTLYLAPTYADGHLQAGRVRFQLGSVTPAQLTVDAYADRAEIIRTDPLTYQTKVIPFSPKAVFEGSEADNHRLNRLDQVVVASQLRPPALVLVEGEVRRVGYFTIETGERLSSVLKRAGGFTSNAFPNGIMLVRESVKVRQQTELDRFIASERQRLTAQSAGIAAGTAGLTAASAFVTGGTIAEQQVLSLRLQQLEAIASRVELGRVVVRLDSIEQLEGTEDDIILEARDRVTIPTPPQTVGIIGSVKNPSTVVYRPGLELDDYLRQAGGITEDAHKREMYVMRANGTTDSAYLYAKEMRPGDTIVVPQKVEARPPQLALWQTVASIIGSLALTAAGIAVSPTGDVLYVGRNGDDVVDIAAIDVETGATRVIELTTAPGASVDAIRVSADGTKVFAAVTTPAGGSLAIIDTGSGAVQRTAALGGSIGDIAVAPRGRKVFVTGWDAELGGVIHVVDAAAARLIDTVALGGLPTQLVFDRGGDIAFVVDRDQIVVLCTATHEVIDSVVIGGQLSCLAASPDGARLYAADYAGTITALRVEAGTGHALHELVSTGLRELAAAAS